MKNSKYKELITRLKNKDIKDKLEYYNELVEETLLLDNTHFKEDKSLVTDEEYDFLCNLIKKFESKYGYSNPNSPSVRVADDTTGYLPTIKHKTPILSLGKGNNEEDLRDYFKRMEKYGLKTDKYIVELKEDGLTGVVNYSKENKNVKNILVATRGTGGKVGENITKGVEILDTLPKFSKLQGNSKVKDLEEVTIRGEFLILDEDFKRINAENKEQGKDMYSSSRNLASGSVRTLDTTVAKKRGVIFSAYNVEKGEEIGFETELEMLSYLEESGFKVVQYKVFDNTEEGINKLIKYCTEFDELYRDKLDHVIDGLVIKPNSIQGRNRIGNTIKAPRWAIAYKFKSKKAVTKVEDVIWQVGKTGQITPVGIVEPVELGEVIVTRSSLANVGILSKLDIALGDKIEIERANDVIPKIVKCVEHGDNREEIKVPKNCPVCNGDVELEKDVLYCKNPLCEGQLRKKLEYFVGKEAMDIDGFGEKAVNTLWEEGVLRTFSDIYKLNEHEDSLLKIERFGKKKVSNLLKAIDDSKGKGMYNILVGLGVRNFGKDMSTKLVERYSSIDELIEDAKKEDFITRLESIDGVGKVTAKAVKESMTDENIISELLNLKGLGLNITRGEESIKEVNTSSGISGKTFVVTGTLSKSRGLVEQDIKENGGKVTKSVTGKTDYLVMGDGADGTSKHKKALSNNTPIITEDDLYSMI